MVYDMVSPDANIILGSVVDKTMGNEICVTIIATGLEPQVAPQAVITPAVVQPAVAPVVMTKMEAAYTPPIHEPNPSAENIFTAQAPLDMHQAEHKAAIEESFDMDDLDTPTFMRKRAADQSAKPLDE